MKKLILVAGAIIALGLVCCGVVGFFLYSGSQTVASDFFEMVATGDGDQFMAQCGPTLQEELDPPVVEAWMKAMTESLGPFQYTQLNGLNVNSSMETANRSGAWSANRSLRKGLRTWNSRTPTES